MNIINVMSHFLVDAPKGWNIGEFFVLLNVYKK